jgi:membrane-associated protein
VALFVGAGYFFGNIPVVAENLEYMVIGIIVVSVAPTAYHAIKSRFSKAPAASSADGDTSGDSV